METACAPSYGCTFVRQFGVNCRHLIARVRIKSKCFATSRQGKESLRRVFYGFGAKYIWNFYKHLHRSPRGDRARPPFARAALATRLEVGKVSRFELGSAYATPTKYAVQHP